LRLLAQEYDASHHWTSGILQVFNNGAWGNICDKFFDVHEADVACKQLGFSSGAKLFDIFVVSPENGVLPSPDIADSLLAPFALEALGCVGHEGKLVDCAVEAASDDYYNAYSAQCDPILDITQQLPVSTI
jgi:hypothetical protein